MASELVGGSARIVDVAGSDKASDHRAIYAQFYDHEIGEPAAAPLLKPTATQVPAQPAQQPVQSPDQASTSSSHKILVGIVIFDTVAIIGLGMALVRWKKKQEGP